MPVLVSSLVVVFAVVEVLILPFLAQTFLWQEPLVAGAWIGLAVKTDGAAVAGGGITEALILAKALPSAAGEANAFRVIFFILTFFSIGVLSDFRKLWQQGFGKLAAVYFVSLFGFVIWVGLLISWLFFSGFKPPLVS